MWGNGIVDQTAARGCIGPSIHLPLVSDPALDSEIEIGGTRPLERGVIGYMRGRRCVPGAGVEPARA